MPLTGLIFYMYFCPFFSVCHKKEGYLHDQDESYQDPEHLIIHLIVPGLLSCIQQCLKKCRAVDGIILLLGLHLST